jgi:cobalt/nickel transport system permease protein
VSLIPHPSGKIRRSSFLEKTLTDINHTLEQSLFADTIARQTGLLQALDPRLKIVCLIALLFTIGFSHNLIALIVLYLSTLLLAIPSRIPLPNFLKRVWGFILLFTFLMALPALFMTPGPSLARILPGLAITRTGALAGTYLILRVGTSISLAALFILTTPWNDVLKSLGVLHLPDVLVLTLGMTYRYLHLLLHIVNEMFLSRKSRTIRRMTNREGRELMGNVSGTLLSKSLQLSSEVYLAMESRGFRNYPKTLHTFQMHRQDWAAGIIVGITCFLTIWLGRG